MESQALERSALERKDREELLTIAQALGGKPGSRARKADIVDLILQLAGVAPDEEASGNGSGAPAADEAEAASGGRGTTRRRTRKAPAAAEDAGGGDEAEGGDRSEEAGKAEGGDRSQEAGKAEGGDRSEKAGKAEGGDRSEKAGKAEGGDRSEKAGKAEGGDRSDDAGGSEKADDDQQEGRQRNRGGDQQKDRQQDQQKDRGGDQQKDRQRNRGGDQQGGGGGQGEPGNRRRRRRGRDRDRERQDEPFQGEPVPVAGLLDLRDDGYGFLRVKGFLPSKDDVYVSVKQARQFNLRKGDHIEGASRPASRNEKNPALLRIDKVNGGDPEASKDRSRFEDLTPLFPDEKLRLELADDPKNMTARIIDLISPIGKGQRGLIVSPPKAGKTTVMKQIARSIETNDPDVHLMVLLIDERPEEVTDFRRWLLRGDVVASTFDRPSDEHTQVAELAIERAKRMVEEGKDVVIILDGITRLSRAYNLAAPATGRIMSGGIDTGALYPPKRFFGAARNVEEGGSLTILATALVETGSKMDEVIFEEFKGTGNMELKLDRRLAERRIYPAIDVDASSTRHEELLFDRKQLNMVWKLRRVLSGLATEGNAGPGLEMLVDRLSTFKSNDEFLAEIAKAPS